MYQHEKNIELASRDVSHIMQPTAKSFFRAMARRKGPILGIAITIPSIFIAQHITRTGCDFVFIDMEHSPLSPERMTQIVHTVVSSSRGFCFPVVRVPSHNVEWIKWSLDSGAAGIVIPMVNNKDEMKQIIDSVLYPPRGKRSFGPALAPWGLAEGANGGVPAYYQRAVNGDIGIFPMIESVEGVANVEEIIMVEGVSGVFVGPVDLRLSLGLTGADGSEQAYISSLQRVCKTCKKHGKLVGSIGMGKETARSRAEDGMDFLVISADAAAMATALDNDLKLASQVTSSCAGSSI